jgi:adenylyl-sulfate kinase
MSAKHMLRSPITREGREQAKSQYALCIWFTGLSGAGKTTLAEQLETVLFGNGFHTFLLDGDQCRNGLCKDLDFSPEGRAENIRRISEIARLMVDAGLIVIVSVISPLKTHRANARALFPKDRFVEIYVNTPFSVCETRDPKGLYKKARRGIIAEFTGLTSPYEVPESPEAVIAGVGCPADTIDRAIMPLFEALQNSATHATPMVPKTQSDYSQPKRVQRCQGNGVLD